jgi:hypothetical protein
MKRLIRKILREHKSDKHYRILDTISNYVEIPYFKSMEGLTIYDEDDQEYIMKKIYGDDIHFDYFDDSYYIFDGNNNEIYYEHSDDGGWWEKSEYDDNRNLIYFENSIGYIRDYR